MEILFVLYGAWAHLVMCYTEVELILAQYTHKIQDCKDVNYDLCSSHLKGHALFSFVFALRIGSHICGRSFSAVVRCGSVHLFYLKAHLIRTQKCTAFKTAPGPPRTCVNQLH